MRHLIVILIFSSSILYSQQAAFIPVPITNVQLTDEFWLPQIKTVQEKTIAFALDKCIAEGRLENFLIAGGLMKGKTRGVMPFDDTDIYKIIEGASYTLISSPNPELEKQLADIISIIAIGQEEDGYLTTWRTIDGQHPPANWVNPGERWENLAASHELYNAGHLFEAAAAHHAATGSDAFLNIATGYADLLVETFGPGKLETVPGHQIVETGLIKLYRITGKRAYLELAKYFLDHRGDSSNHELFGAYSQDHIPVIEQREVVGHAVRAVYMYAGMTDVAELYQDQEYLNSSKALWDNMTEAKLYITGGIGARHEGESFGDNYELPSLTAYAETCAAIGSIIWSQRLYNLTGKVDYYDLIERTLYNGVISGISLNGTHFFYPNCLSADKEYAFNRGNHTRAEWFDCSCCPTNVIRFLPSMPGYLYATSSDTLAINLYASSKAQVTLAGTHVGISQETRYPWDGDIAIEVTPELAKKFTIKLRIPGWARNIPTPGDLYRYTGENKSKEPSLWINGEPLSVLLENGYYVINRVWQPGDIVRLSLSMPVRFVEAKVEVKELRKQIAIERGPLVYCFEETDNTIEVKNILLSTDDKFEANRSAMLNGIVSLVAQQENAQLTAIPYYAWSNRGVTSMDVWVSKE